MFDEQDKDYFIVFTVGIFNYVSDFRLLYSNFTTIISVCGLVSITPCFH